MEGKDNISDYRSKLDKTLASPDLTNDEIVRTLVKNQISQSSNFQFEEYMENVVERKTREVSNFLNMLRSASKSSSKESRSGWKVKEDTHELRVMYREGPEGTPFHSLLAEGYVDGPLDVCLCISWESALYQKWWPQVVVPTFKVISSRSLKRVRTGENISLVRMKVSWPLSSREALIHYFAFEYFQEGLVVVLLNSISDSEIIDRSTHGFTRDGIPNAEDVVRIDVVGGFALQKVTADRSFFRTIANMDIKLDFVPPALINFISRQLVGSGFRLYKKEIASVSKGDEIFLGALKDTMYARIRKALYLENEPMESLEQESLKINTSVELEEKRTGEFEDNDSEEINHCDDSAIASKTHDIVARDRKMRNEIVELDETETEGSESFNKNIQELSDDLSSEVPEKLRADKEVVSQGVEQISRKTDEMTEILRSEKKKVAVSREVEQALETLEKIISIFRETNRNSGKCQSDINKGNLVNLQTNAVEESIPTEANRLSRKTENCTDSSKIVSTEMTSKEHSNGSSGHASRHGGSTCYQKESNQSQGAPTSPDKDQSRPSQTQHNVLNSFINQKTESTVFVKAAETYPKSADANSMNGYMMTKRKNKKSRFWCLHFTSGK